MKKIEARIEDYMGFAYDLSEETKGKTIRGIEDEIVKMFKTMYEDILGERLDDAQIMTPSELKDDAGWLYDLKCNEERRMMVAEEIVEKSYDIIVEYGQYWKE